MAKWPVVRGVVNLCTQLGRGYRMLMKSADYIALTRAKVGGQRIRPMGRSGHRRGGGLAIGCLWCSIAADRMALAHDGQRALLVEGLFRI